MQSNAMDEDYHDRASDATTMVEAPWQTVGESFDRFCLTAGIASLTQMMDTGRCRWHRQRR
jgi:hypothetical protein